MENPVGQKLPDRLFCVSDCRLLRQAPFFIEGGQAAIGLHGGQRGIKGGFVGRFGRENEGQFFVGGDLVGDFEFTGVFLDETGGADVVHDNGVNIASNQRQTAAASALKAARSRVSSTRVSNTCPTWT